MSKLIAIFSYLDGKKTFIVAFLALTVAYAGLMGGLDQHTQSYLQAVLALVAGGAEVATVKLGARKL